jgi:hypothetical protein
MLAQTLVSAALLASSALAYPLYAAPSQYDLDAYYGYPAVSPYERMYFDAQDYLEELATMKLVDDVNTMDKQTVLITGLLKNFKGDQKDAEAIQAASDKLVEDIKTTTSNLNSQKNIGLKDALALGTAFQAFIPHSTESIDAIVAAKPFFDKLGQTQAVHDSLAAQRKLGDKLNAVINGKLPSFARSQAKESAALINDPLDKAIAAYATAA